MARRTAPPTADRPRTRTVAYIRVSTEGQAEHGVSLEAQEEMIRAYSKLYGLDLVAVEVDAGVSASTLDRPALGRALALLENGETDALLVAKLDRLTRSVRDLGGLVDRFFASGRWSLLSVSEAIDTRTAGGRLVLNVLASVSQWEREAVGERTSVAMRYKVSKGEFTGGVIPFGFRLAADGKTLEGDEEEQQVIRLACTLRQKNLSLRHVAQELNCRGFRPRRAARFGPVQVQRILERRHEAAAVEADSVPVPDGADRAA